MISEEAISKALSEVKKSKKRKFVQSIDLTLTLKDIDLSKPENRINEEVVLPHGRGKPNKIGVIADGEMALQAKKIADRVITKEELEDLSKEKKKAKKIAREVDFFIAQSDHMPIVGRSLGPVLGPRGKMPKPLPPGAPLEPIIERLRKTVRIRTKENPVIHVPIGTEEMQDDKLVQNISTVLEFVGRKLEGNIKSVYLSTTMGRSVKV